ncbi:MAG: RNA polymerase factor sigma-54 [Gammaproteobacteria bacterium]|nr:RNA polymerase factor sigma-54 [Gammaproteobacteria bacterium]
MKQALNLQLSQQLTLTPQLKQSLKLLQLSSLDLEQEIQLAIDSNPLLERIENEVPEVREIQELSPTLDNGIMQPVAESSDPNAEIERTDHLAPEQDLTANWEEAFESRRTTLSSGTSGRDTEFTQFVVRQDSLYEHLAWQIKMTSLSDRDQLIAQAILHCLDAEGYLKHNPSEIVEMLDSNLEVEDDEVSAVLSLIKTLDPLGAGCQDLRERLLVLLKNKPEHSKPSGQLAENIIDHHLDLVGNHNLTKLKRSLSVTEEELSEALALITTLNPRIGSAFSSDNENYVTPDVIVKKAGDKWTAQLNSESQTKLRVNETYSQLLKKSEGLDKDSSQFIQTHLLEAKNFIKGLMSRYDTLLLVSRAIVERQQAFFEQGETQMKPMVLQDIADALEMHESTISRATSGKYLLSPRGVYELKYFFSSAVSNTDGATSSSTAIRSLIKKLIDSESKTKPLSDSKIAKELETQGHIVARRTVAKYRESMHIAPSSQRKSLTG